jgi:hypothetical protein
MRQKHPVGMERNMEVNHLCSGISTKGMVPPEFLVENVLSASFATFLTGICTHRE